MKFPAFSDAKCIYDYLGWLFFMRQWNQIEQQGSVF